MCGGNWKVGGRGKGRGGAWGRGLGKGVRRRREKAQEEGKGGRRTSSAWVKACICFPAILSHSCHPPTPLHAGIVGAGGRGLEQQRRGRGGDADADAEGVPSTSGRPGSARGQLSLDAGPRKRRRSEGGDGNGSNGGLQRAGSGLPPSPVKLDALRHALTIGFANKLARRMRMHNGYKTANEAGQLAQLHPGSAHLKADDDGLLPEWVIYHELVATSRPYLRQVRGRGRVPRAQGRCPPGPEALKGGCARQRFIGQWCADGAAQDRVASRQAPGRTPPSTSLTYPPVPTPRCALLITAGSRRCCPSLLASMFGG
jgi:hypothetical protein